MKFNGKWSSKAETLTILDKNQKKLGIHVPKNYYFISIVIFIDCVKY